MDHRAYPSNQQEPLMSWYPASFHAFGRPAPRRAAIGLVIGFGIALVLGPSRVPAQDVSTTPASPLTERQVDRWRLEIRSMLFALEQLPALEPEVHGRFEPAAGVVAERVT